MSRLWGENCPRIWRRVAWSSRQARTPLPNWAAVESHRHASGSEAWAVLSQVGQAAATSHLDHIPGIEGGTSA
eukprot:scaffold1922_cov101-Isochrysis_galbana.AAC.2